MGNPLLDRRTPQELAAGRQVIEIKEKIDNFKRLAAVVQADLEALDAENRPKSWREAPVSVLLDFGFVDAQSRQPGVSGEVATEVAAVCQRCLGPMTVPLKQPLKLLFGEASMADSDSEYEIWELEEDRLRPMDLVEEVLIMAMPFAAMHEEACDAAPVAKTNGEQTAKRTTSRPFADLKSQMDRKN